MATPTPTPELVTVVVGENGANRITKCGESRLVDGAIARDEHYAEGDEFKCTPEIAAALKKNGWVAVLKAR